MKHIVVFFGVCLDIMWLKQCHNHLFMGMANVATIYGEFGDGLLLF